MRNLEAMAPDMIVMRHASSGAPHLLARLCRSAIINAGDGMHEHPTQALLDAFTIREHKGRLAGLKVAIVGDLLHSRVLRSNVQLLNKMGAERLGLRADDADARRSCDRFGVRTTTSIDEAVDGRRRGDDAAHPARADARPLHPVDARILRAVRPDARSACARREADVIIMHPGPMNRGVEIDSDVADGPYSVILEQVTNGVAVRMAVLYLLAGRDTDGATAKDEAAAEGRAGRRSRARPRRRVRRADRGRANCAKIGKALPVDGAEVVELKPGWIVAPGLIDIHVHLREPGQEHKETIATGTASAVAGGFTAVACMPNTDPVNDHPGITELILRKAAEADLARVYPIGAVSMGSRGEQMAELGEQKAAGCVAFTDDGRPVATRAADAAGARVRRDARRADRRSLRGSVAQGGRRRARGLSTPSALGLRGIPGVAESIMVERDIALAELTGGAVPRLPHERAAVAARGARRQGARRDQRHLRGRAASFRADRRRARGAGQATTPTSR